MAFDDSKYRKGYSIGVGGVVLCGDKVLLARRARGSGIGDWTIPGGFVERDETIEVAVQREVLEETGVRSEVDGLIAARNRITQNENSAYFIFLLRAQNETAKVDGFEIDQARFFTFSEIQTLDRLQPLSRLVVTKVLQGQTQLLVFHQHPQYTRDEYLIFA